MLRTDLWLETCGSGVVGTVRGLCDGGVCRNIRFDGCGWKRFRISLRPAFGSDGFAVRDCAVPDVCACDPVRVRFGRFDSGLPLSGLFRPFRSLRSLRSLRSVPVRPFRARFGCLGPARISEFVSVTSRGPALSNSFRSIRSGLTLSGSFRSLRSGSRLEIGLVIRIF